MTHSFPYTTLFRSPCDTQTWERESHDPRAAGLPLRARPPAGAAEALRDRHPEALGKAWHPPSRSEEHTSELQSLMRRSYAVFCLKKKKNTQYTTAIT